MTTSARVGDHGGRTAEWVVALTVAIQRWARDPVWQGSVLRADDERVQVAIPWRRHDVFDEALDLALHLVNQWSRADGGEVPGVLVRWLKADRPISFSVSLNGHFGQRWPAIQAGGLSPYTVRFAEAAARRGLPFDILPGSLQIGWGVRAQRFDMTFTKDTSWIAAALAKNKFKASRTLAGEAIPVPLATMVSTVDEANEAAERLGWPVVVKPLNCDQGVGVTARIEDAQTLATAVDTANGLSPGAVVVERHVDGDDFRMLVVHGRTLMAVRRTPGGVTGDGVHTVAQLVDMVNSDPQRGTAQFSRLKTLVLDDLAIGCLRQQGLDPAAVPSAGRFVWLRRIANISTGGTAQDVTAQVHPDNRALAERAAAIIGLDIAGVDVLTPDITRSWRDVGAAICEVNAQPAFRVHWLADPTRDIEGEVLDILCDQHSARIPLVAVVGGDAAAVAERVDETWTAMGVLSGVCTTRGVRSGGQIISDRHVTGRRGLRALLIDPGVQRVVVELQPAAVAADGHPCDGYDVVAVLDAHGVPQSEFVERTRDVVVLNGDDPGCVALASRATTQRVILVTRDAGQPAVSSHLGSGGAVVTVDVNGAIVACRDGAEITVATDAGDRTGLFAAAVLWAQSISGERH